MSNPPSDKTSPVAPIAGEMSVQGPHAETADRATQGPVETIDPDNPAALALWAQRLGVNAGAVRNAVIAVGPDSEAVALRLKSARGAAD